MKQRTYVVPINVSQVENVLVIESALGPVGVLVNQDVPPKRCSDAKNTITEEVCLDIFSEDIGIDIVIIYTSR